MPSRTELKSGSPHGVIQLLQYTHVLTQALRAQGKKQVTNTPEGRSAVLHNPKQNQIILRHAAFITERKPSQTVSHLLAFPELQHKVLPHDLIQP